MLVRFGRLPINFIRHLSGGGTPLRVRAPGGTADSGGEDLADHQLRRRPAGKEETGVTLPPPFPKPHGAVAGGVTPSPDVVDL